MTIKAKINPFLCTVSRLTALLGVAVCMVRISVGDLPAFFIFLALGILFGAIGFYYGGCIEISQDDIALVRPLLSRRSMAWNQVCEIGVCGMKIFNAADTKHRGTQYFYFSAYEMDDQQRFEMLLHWPPKETLFCRFDKHLLPLICTYWKKPLVLYNADQATEQCVVAYNQSQNTQEPKGDYYETET